TLFEQYAVGRSRRSVAELMDIRPDFANLEENGETLRVAPDTVPVGAVIVVRPGEKIPIDGEVITGESAVDTAALTGESLPRDVFPGDPVI
ncbi:MAG TPA: heavy metal translocating P-type ATPase, partial [Clostridiales bacterium]|nr:heavy metal translocating P-type ATPase [Clostridiales bacterium]